MGSPQRHGEHRVNYFSSRSRRGGIEKNTSPFGHLPCMQMLYAIRRMFGSCCPLFRWRQSHISPGRHLPARGKVHLLRALDVSVVNSSTFVALWRICNFDCRSSIDTLHRHNNREKGLRKGDCPVYPEDPHGPESIDLSP